MKSSGDHGSIMGTMIAEKRGKSRKNFRTRDMKNWQNSIQKSLHKPNAREVSRAVRHLKGIRKAFERPRRCIGLARDISA